MTVSLVTTSQPWALISRSSIFRSMGKISSFWCGTQRDRNVSVQWRCNTLTRRIVWYSLMIARARTLSTPWGIGSASSSRTLMGGLTSKRYLSATNATWPKRRWSMESRERHLLQNSACNSMRRVLRPDSTFSRLLFHSHKRSKKRGKSLHR